MDRNRFASAAAYHGCQSILVPATWEGRALARESVGTSLACFGRFHLRARLGVSVIRSPTPATSHVACRFPALRADRVTFKIRMHESRWQFAGKASSTE